MQREGKKLHCMYEQANENFMERLRIEPENDMLHNSKSDLTLMAYNVSHIFP